MIRTKTPRALLASVALFAVVVSTASAQTVTLTPVADAHVLSGPGLEKLNVGKLPLLEVNRSSLPLPWFDREIYLKFDLSNVTSVRTAKLRLYGASHGPQVITTHLLSSPDVSWTETGIKWTNKPAPGPVIWDTIALQDQNAWHEWDISQYLMGEKAVGRNVVSLVLRNVEPTGLGINLFHSREHPNHKPELVIEQAFPWTYYEAEEGTASAGAVLETGVLWGDIGFEARGKKAVTLDAVGESIEWPNVRSATHALIRYSIPDGDSGSLAIYVNGVKKTDFALTSEYMREARTGVAPPNGGIVKLYEDALVEIAGGVPAGATVRVQKEIDDGVPVTIDLLELDTAPPPLEKPEDTWVSVEQGTGSDRMAFVNAINAANAGSKKVWVPAGHYVINAPVAGEPNRTGLGIEIPAGITIRGAGFWHTSITMNYAGNNRRVFTFIGNDVTISDMKVFGTLTTLTDNGQVVVIRMNDFTTGHVIERMWAERLGISLGFHVSNTIVRDNRVRNTFKDSIHFARTSANNLIERNAVRNSGDDNVALVSYQHSDGMGNNIVQYNVAECGWWGRGFTNIGGDGNIIRHNLANNCIRAGVACMLEQFGSPEQQTQFNTNWVVERNVIVRCGDQISNPITASLAIYAAQDYPMSGRMEHNLVLAPPFHGGRIQGFVGDPDTDNVVYYRYNMVEAPLGGPTYLRKVTTQLNANSNVVHEPNIDL